MLSHPYIRLAEIALVAVLTASLLFAWRAERHDRAQLTIELATAKQALAAADSRQHDRDTQLVQTLSTLATQKRNVTTPEQILRALPQQIPLPTPFTLTGPPEASQELSSMSPGRNPTHPAPDASHRDTHTPEGNITSAGNITTQQAVIPTEDLKPLYDFAIDCQACQAKLAATRGDLADEQTKTATLTKERDAAIRTAKGGSTLHRIAQAAKWLAIGAAAGALAARTTH